MINKKNGEAIIFIATCFFVGYFLSRKRFNSFKSKAEENTVSIEKYVNRLSEFDLGKERYTVDLFLQLIKDGINPRDAFEISTRASAESKGFKS